MKILAGVHRPDAGTLELAAETVPNLRSPRRAAAAGIATVFQEVLVVDPRSVLENVWMGSDGVFAGPCPRRREAPAGQAGTRRAPERVASARHAGGAAVPQRAAGMLPRPCAVRDPRILILDEATSALDVATRDRLFELLGSAPKPAPR